MNPITFFTLLISNNVAAWNWKGMKASNSPDLCSAPKAVYNTSNLNWGVCWEAMTFKRIDLTNFTAIFQPGFWERDYSEIGDFCSSRGNGTFCYRSQSQFNDSCLDMAVVRCPEGIISSCRSNFICNEIMMNQNISCNSTMGTMFNTSYTETGQARCEAIEDVIKLPFAENVTTTVDQQNRTITVGSQVFKFPFVSTTTVGCTFTCLSTLPSGFPQPTQAITACFNDSIPYDDLLPKSTCAGPYPPGPMTTITETLSNNIIPSMESTITSGLNSSSIESTTCMPSSSSSTSICPIESSINVTSTAMSEYPVGSSVPLVPSTELSSPVIIQSSTSTSPVKQSPTAEISYFSSFELPYTLESSSNPVY